MREGVELALFITAAFFAGSSENVTTNIILTLTGVVPGLWNSSIAWLVITGSSRPAQSAPFLSDPQVICLILFAAGLWHMAFMNSTKLVGSLSIIEHVWDVNTIVDETLSR